MAESARKVNQLDLESSSIEPASVQYIYYQNRIEGARNSPMRHMKSFSSKAQVTNIIHFGGMTCSQLGRVSYKGRTSKMFNSEPESGNILLSSLIRPSPYNAILSNSSSYVSVSSLYKGGAAFITFSVVTKHNYVQGSSKLVCDWTNALTYQDMPNRIQNETTTGMSSNTIFSIARQTLRKLHHRRAWPPTLKNSNRRITPIVRKSDTVALHS